ncbi:MAG TPA: glycosyltransferase family 4 protein [Candidatus Limnocylindrales bacterium]|nr:glycosyltransferase family 4 protein [Candidatus Limnocylindrales bacterium]
MKVLMNTDTLGGVWTYSLTLAAEITRRGGEVALVTAGRPLSRDQIHALEQLRSVHVYETGYRVEWMQDAWDDVDALGQRMLQIAADLRPDLIHLNDYSHGALPWQQPVVVVGHSCVLSWFASTSGSSPGELWAHYRRRVREGLAGADVVVAPTPWMLQRLEEMYGPLGRTRVIANGHDMSLVTYAAKEKLIFSAGRLWDRAKNLTVLAHAASKVEWPMYVAGEAQHPESRSFAHLAGVHAVGVLSPDQMRDWYARSSIYALPARYEPFGLTVLEAAAAGCALVLSDIDSLRQSWDRAAVFVPPDDSDAWANCLNELIDDADRRNGLGVAARERARDFTATRMGDEYMTVYKELIGEQRGTGRKATQGELSCAS